jgi:hypothetical protein
VFETMAALSTLAFIAIFVILFRIDRAGRREDAAAAAEESRSSQS